MVIFFFNSLNFHLTFLQHIYKIWRCILQFWFILILTMCDYHTQILVVWEVGLRLHAARGGFTQLPLHKGIPKVFFVASASFLSLFPYTKNFHPLRNTQREILQPTQTLGSNFNQNYYVPKLGCRQTEFFWVSNIPTSKFKPKL